MQMHEIRWFIPFSVPRFDLVHSSLDILNIADMWAKFTYRLAQDGNEKSLQKTHNVAEVGNYYYCSNFLSFSFTNLNIQIQFN